MASSNTYQYFDIHYSGGEKQGSAIAEVAVHTRFGRGSLGAAQEQVAGMDHTTRDFSCPSNSFTNKLFCCQGWTDL